MAFGKEYVTFSVPILALSPPPLRLLPLSRCAAHVLSKMPLNICASPLHFLWEFCSLAKVSDQSERKRLRNSGNGRTDQIHPNINSQKNSNSYFQPSQNPQKLPKMSPQPHPMPKLIFQKSNHPKQALIDGEVWPPVFEPDNVRSAKKMVPLGTDVFVCTYPKCGTTWIQHICSQLLYNNEYGPGQGQELCFTSPMIERVGAEFCDSLKYPRLLKTHFSWANLPKRRLQQSSATTNGSPQPKYIFAVRNPKDCCVSYFHHNRNFKIYDWAQGKFDDFFELFTDGGRVAFGDYFEHLLSWLPHLNDANVLFLKYEDMLNNLEESVRKIGHFIGGHAEKVTSNRETLARIVEESRLEAMQRDQQRWFPGSALHSASFVRKGTSRDWKNYMSRAQSDRMDRIFEQKLAGTVAENWWKDEMRWGDEEEEKRGKWEKERAEEAEEEDKENKRGTRKNKRREEEHDSGMESGDDLLDRSGADASREEHSMRLGFPIPMGDNGDMGNQ